jgi:hypothetical protein
MQNQGYKKQYILWYKHLIPLKYIESCLYSTMYSELIILLDLSTLYINPFFVLAAPLLARHKADKIWSNQLCKPNKCSGNSRVSLRLVFEKWIRDYSSSRSLVLPPPSLYPWICRTWTVSCHGGWEYRAPARAERDADYGCIQSVQFQASNWRRHI